MATPSSDRRGAQPVAAQRAEAKPKRSGASSRCSCVPRRAAPAPAGRRAVPRRPRRPPSRIRRRRARRPQRHVGSWVTTTSVRPARVHAPRAGRHISRPEAESRLPVGSSASSSARPHDHGPRDGHALALAARELVGPVVACARAGPPRRGPPPPAAPLARAARRRRPWAARRSPPRSGAAPGGRTGRRSRSCGGGRATARRRPVATSRPSSR